ncbi:MAG: hypothetical protein L6R35_007525, partial [Caloplaca aegaea]
LKPTLPLPLAHSASLVELSQVVTEHRHMVSNKVNTEELNSLTALNLTNSHMVNNHTANNLVNSNTANNPVNMEVHPVYPLFLQLEVMVSQVNRLLNMVNHLVNSSMVSNKVNSTDSNPVSTDNRVTMVNNPNKANMVSSPVSKLTDNNQVNRLMDKVSQVDVGSKQEEHLVREE